MHVFASVEMRLFAAALFRLSCLKLISSLAMRYYSLEKLINLHDGYRKVFQIDSHHLMLLQIEGQRYLIESRCPHREYPLRSSDVQGGELVCPQHGYRFEISSGVLLAASEEPCRNLHCYSLTDRGNEIGVMLDE